MERQGAVGWGAWPPCGPIAPLSGSARAQEPHCPGLNATFPGDAKEGMAEWIGCVDLPTYQWRGLSFTSWYFWARFLSHMRTQWPLYRVNIVHPELWEVLTQRVECFNGQQTLTLVPSVLYQHRPIWSATCMSLNTLFFMCVHLCSPKPFPSPTSWPYIIRGDVLTPFIVDNPQQTRKNNTQAFDGLIRSCRHHILTAKW